MIFQHDRKANKEETKKPAHLTKNMQVHVRLGDRQKTKKGILKLMIPSANPMMTSVG